MPWIDAARASGESASPESTVEEPSTRERLLSVAAELFAERGYVGASLGDIAGRLGVRKPSLYNYFSSKEELFIQLLRDSLEAWREASAPGLNDPVLGSRAGGHRQRLRDHLQRIVDFAVDSPHAMALCRLALSQLGGDLEERAGELLRAQRDEYHQEVEAFFTEAREAGSVAPYPVDLMTLAWLTFLDGILTHELFSHAGRKGLYLSQLEGLWRLFWRSLAPSDGPSSEEGR